jgi:hypothetical protein
VASTRLAGLSLDRLQQCFGAPNAGAISEHSGISRKSLAEVPPPVVPAESKRPSQIPGSELETVVSAAFEPSAGGFDVPAQCHRVRQASSDSSEPDDAVSRVALDRDHAATGVTAQVGCARDLNVRRIVDENPAGLRERGCELGILDAEAACVLGQDCRKPRVARIGRLGGSHGAPGR